MMIEIVIVAVFMAAFLIALILFPGLSFCEWLKKKFGEAEESEPVVWK